jgi:hypothetical protein
MRNRASYNPKRRISDQKTAEELKDLASKVRYGGNPEHKRNPGDFGLTPPAMPRPDKTLCDTAGIFKRNEATRLLKKGVRKGLVSIREKNGFPQNIWTISKEGHPLEAQLENQDQGIYHGYPMPENDPFCQVVLEMWRNR